MYLNEVRRSACASFAFSLPTPSVPLQAVRLVVSAVGSLHSMQGIRPGSQPGQRFPIDSPPASRRDARALEATVLKHILDRPPARPQQPRRRCDTHLVQAGPGRQRCDWLSLCLLHLSASLFSALLRFLGVRFSFLPFPCLSQPRLPRPTSVARLFRGLCVPTPLVGKTWGSCRKCPGVADPGYRVVARFPIGLVFLAPFSESHNPR